MFISLTCSSPTKRTVRPNADQDRRSPVGAVRQRRLAGFGEISRRVLPQTPAGPFFARTQLLYLCLAGSPNTTTTRATPAPAAARSQRATDGEDKGKNEDPHAAPRILHRGSRPY
jgi:hypothetical protein